MYWKSIPDPHLDHISFAYEAFIFSRNNFQNDTENIGLLYHCVFNWTARTKQSTQYIILSIKSHMT